MLRTGGSGGAEMTARLALVFASFAIFCFAQTVSSTLQGTVQDPTGAVVPGATCKLANTATNVAVTVTSDANGVFRFLEIQAGTYNLAISAPGFKNFELSGID